MSTFDKAKKKVRKAAEKTEEEAKEAGGKIRRAGKKGVEEARKVGHETREKLKLLSFYSAYILAYLSCHMLIDICFACPVRLK